MGLYDNCLLIDFQINGDTSDLYTYVSRPPASGLGMVVLDASLSNTGNTMGTMVIPSLSARFAYNSGFGTMDIDVSDKASISSLGSAAFQPTGTFATAAQGTKADSAIQGTGSTAQYIRGNGSLATFPTAVSAFSNDANYVTSSGLTSTLASYATNAALTSGLSGKFNTPVGSTSQYLRGDGSLATFPSIPSGTVTSVGLSSTTLSISGGPITSSGNITINTIARSFAFPSRTLNSAFQISTTRDASVSYAVDIGATLTLTGGQTGTVILEIADDSGFTTNVQTVNSTANGNTGTLTIGLSLTQTSTATLAGIIPANKFVRLRTVNTTGSPSFTYRTGQEVLL